MGYINIQSPEGTIESIVSGEAVPPADLHDDPRTSMRPQRSDAQAAHEIGMGDGSWPPPIRF